MKNNLMTWFAPRRWRRSLNKIMILAGVVTGGLTTYSEASPLVHGDVVVATILTLLFQGGMYVSARFAKKNACAKQRPLTIVLCLTWVLLAIFPAYASGLNMFDTLDSFLQDILPLLLDHASKPKKGRAENILGAPHEDYNFQRPSLKKDIQSP